MAIEWFTAWLPEHFARHPFAKLPDPAEASSAPYYAEWEESFHEERLFARDVADAASRRLFRQPPRYHQDHFPTLLKYAAEARDSGRAAAGGGPQHDLSTREGAELASRSCGRCGGGGLATAWHPRPDYSKGIPEAVAAYCACSLGRWIKGVHEKKSPDVLRRMVDLEDVIARRSGWLAERPGVAVAAGHADADVDEAF